jgi:hypothetical protein
VCVVSAGRELEGDSRGYRSAEEQARELTRSIRREVNKLSEKWNALIDRSDQWQRKLDDSLTVSPHLCYVRSVTVLMSKRNVCTVILLDAPYEGVTKSFRTESITKYTLTLGITRCCLLQSIPLPNLYNEFSECHCWKHRWN